jgi:hypothetical protein
MDDESMDSPESFLRTKPKDQDEPEISFFDLFESIFKEKVNEWVQNQEKEMENLNKKEK